MPSPKTPAGLEKHGRELWTAAWNAGESWLSEEIDAAAVEQACLLVDEIADMRAKIKEHGVTTLKPVTAGGLVVGAERQAHPLLRELRAAERQLREWFAALGFEPTARKTLGIKEHQEDGVDELKTRRAERRARVAETSARSRS